MRNTKTRQRICASIAVAMLFAGASVEAQKIGLSSQFVNVLLEGLQVGKSYNLLELRGVPYTVKNRGDGVAKVRIDIEQPSAKLLFPGYEPIPDTSWLTISPAEAVINPGDSAFGALTINIPDDPKWIGRHFHGVIWAHIDTKGWFATGVRSNIRFSTGKSPETMREEEKYRAMVKLNYDMWPSSLYVNKAKVGEYDVDANEKRSFLLTNRDEDPIELVISAVAWARPNLPPGYEKVEDVSWVKFEPSEIKVDGLSLQKVKLHLDVPKKYAGKKLALMAALSLPIGTIVNMSHRILITVDGNGEATVTTEKDGAAKEKSKEEKK